MNKFDLEFDKEKFGLEIEFASVKSDNVIKMLSSIEPNNEEEFNTWTFSRETFSEIRKGSIFGGEIASPILSNDEKSLNDLKYVLKKLKKLNATTNGNQSLQVRVSNDIFEENNKYVYNFLKLYYAYEDIIYKFGYNGENPRESITTFAKPCDYKLQTILNAHYDSISFYSYISFINMVLLKKQHGLDFHDRNNPNMPKSFEFRMFNATFDFKTVLNEVNTVIALIKRAKNDIDMELINERINEAKYKPTNYFSAMKNDKAKEFANIIFDDEKSVNKFMMQYKKR